MSTVKNKGFTLIELMIVIAIIGVLATVAFPAYQKHITRTKRSDAKVALLALQQAMEKYRANCAQYPTRISPTGTRTCVAGSTTVGDHDMVALDDPIGAIGTVPTYPSPKGYYTLYIAPAVSSGSPNDYRIVAYIAGSGEQAGDTECAKFQIDTSMNPQQTSYSASAPAVDNSAICWK